MIKTELDLQSAVGLLVDHGRRLNADGLAIGPAGNLSIRLGDRIAITPSQVPYNMIDAEMVCLVNFDGTQLGGTGRPSSELPMHLRIYAETDAQAVVHTHSPVAVAASVAVNELPAVHYCVLRLGGPTVRVAPYERFGSKELATSAITALEDRAGAILQNHGTVAYGGSIETAYERAQLIEYLAIVYLNARLFGQPRILTEDELSAVAAESRRRYGTEATARGENRAP